MENGLRGEVFGTRTAHLSPRAFSAPPRVPLIARPYCTRGGLFARFRAVLDFEFGSGYVSSLNGGRSEDFS